MEVLNIVKIGGNIIDDSKSLDSLLQSFSTLEGNKMLIHGGGKIATEIGFRLGIEPNYVDGRRITDQPTLELVTMVYGGLINKNIVARLQKCGCNGIGLSGADGAMIKAVKRKVKDVDFGFVGDIASDGINTAMLSGLLTMGLTPVIAPLSYSEGVLLNTNADTIANEFAKAMSSDFSVNLIYCFEQIGVLKELGNPSSLIKSLDEDGFKTLQSMNAITKGMIPKLENAFSALHFGVTKVVIGHADHLYELINGTKGTSIL